MNATGGAASTTAAEATRATAMDAPATTESGTAAAAQRPMRADARRNYDRLLAETAAAFAERGNDDVSLEEIARRAQVGIGTLYRHFPSRQALLEAVYRDQVEMMTRRAEELLAEKSSAEALTEWLKLLTAWGMTKRSMNKTLLETLGKDSELLSSAGAMLRESTGKLVERAQQAGVVRSDVVGTDVLRLVHGMMLACDKAPMPQDPGQADRMLSVVLAGLLTHPAQP
jgi:AcrR family transcriptional regulator